MSRLTSITISDFRSIRGTITVPLDAPVVLIHGQNGAGKTSLLSAIELGLTGHLPSFARVDPGYVEHLVHKEADSGRIALSASGLSQTKLGAELQIVRDGLAGAPLLDATLASFFSERCFLPQATLGRLLELYEYKDARKSDSSLTLFVKDLLGLSHLDALIDGLHDAGDVRRFRSTVPSYWETRENIPALSNDLKRLQSEFASVDAAAAATSNAIGTALPTLAIEIGALSDLKALQGRLSEAAEEGELQHLAALRRDISAVEQQWRSLAGDNSDTRSLIQRRASDTALALDAWRTAQGFPLELAFSLFAVLFPDQQQPVDRGLVSLHGAATHLVDADLARLQTLLQRAAKDDSTLVALNQDIERTQARGSALDGQIAELAQDSGQLAKALSDLLPHVHSPDCPVCGRDFSEVSNTELFAHLSARVNELTIRASRLQALSMDRVQTMSALSNAQRQRDVLSSALMEPAARDAAKTREAQLKELQQTLHSLEKVVADGQRLTIEAAVANRALTALQSRDLQSASVRSILIAIASALAVDPPSETEEPLVATARYLSKISMQSAELETLMTARRSALTRTRELEALRIKRASLESDMHNLQDRIAKLTVNKNAADRLIGEGRELAKLARDARTAIVRRVFNESLNSIWRDLFVRLAPEEPFVPAFALPANTTGAVEAVLETHYRSGGMGGNPRAMLSAGNLNTAALTLFLSLHLSVAPTLPWLVIDDPVQSMDEVHIAQFAALLRTLSKAHDRQLIIAVHEKPLFDYLALELSPAFQSDRLNTIELTRGADGRTLMKYQPIVWQPDSAIAA